METILLTYAPQGGYTEQAAYEIAQKITFAHCTILPGSKLTQKELESYSRIIIGIATLGNDSWNSGRQDPDTVHLQKMITQVDFTNKKIALFGLGNAVLYPSHFIDEVGIFEEHLQSKHATIIGYTPISEYTFKDSKAIRGEYLCGLALDYDTEMHAAQSRISSWVTQLEKEL
jgi:flavodoxin I